MGKMIIGTFTIRDQSLVEIFLFLILGLFGHYSGELLVGDESGIAPRRKKKLILDGELERQITDLFEK